MVEREDLSKYRRAGRYFWYTTLHDLAPQPAGALEIEQQALAPEAAAVAAERSVLGNHAMARHEEIKAIGGVGAGDGADRGGGLEARGNLFIAGGLRVGDALQFAPDPLLEIGAAQR